MIRTYIGLGSNLENPKQQIRNAVKALAALPDSRLGEVSSLYLSAPLGPQNQPDYVNAVACVHTMLSPLALLKQLQAIEDEQGRVRIRRWGPRTLDLDLLLYGVQEIRLPELIVPHPGIAQRAFVLQPLLECAPELDIPSLGSVAELARACPDASLRKLTCPIKPPLPACTR